jgi:hypothetical protein
MNLEGWLTFGLKALGVIAVLVYAKRVFALVRESFGHIDKQELAGMILMPILVYLALSNRERNEYTSFEFAVIALIVIYGFGMKHIIQYLLQLKGIRNEKDNDRGGGGDSAATGAGDDMPEQKK